MEQLYQLIQSITALFVIIDPLGNLPIFMGLTEEESKKQRSKIFLTAAIVGFLLLLIFTFAGNFILFLFRISIDAFKIAGGVLLLSIAIMIIIQGQWIPEKEKEEIGAVPLGCPLLVGPGAITTGMVLLGIFGWKLTLAAIIIVFLITILILYFAEQIYNFLGHTGSRIMSKIMSIIIAAVAVQYILDGVLSILR